MEFIRSADSKAGEQAMQSKIVGALLAGKPVLWLICGGSNLPVAVKVMELVRREVTPQGLKLLHVGQTDERYGPVGHSDSNWKQMLNMGFSVNGINTYPMLVNKPLEASISNYSDLLKSLLDQVKQNAGLVIAECGIGTDGHVAGIMPGTLAVSDPRLIFGHEYGPFIRITVTSEAFKYFDVAYTFAFGLPKREVLISLRDLTLPLEKQPAQILKIVPESYIYSDQY